MEEEKRKTPRKRRDLKEGGREVLLLPSLWAADFSPEVSGASCQLASSRQIHCRIVVKGGSHCPIHLLRACSNSIWCWGTDQGLTKYHCLDS